MDKYSLFRTSQETKNIPFTLTTYFVRLPIRSLDLVFILNLNLDCLFMNISLVLIQSNSVNFRSYFMA